VVYRDTGKFDLSADNFTGCFWYSCNSAIRSMQVLVLTRKNDNQSNLVQRCVQVPVQTTQPLFRTAVFVPED
jgi:hypothetical protein